MVTQDYSTNRGDQILYLGHDEFDVSLKYARLYYAKLVVRGRRVKAASEYATFYALGADDFDPATLTYNNKPAYYFTGYVFRCNPPETRGNFTTEINSTSVPVLSSTAAEYARKRAIALYDNDIADACYANITLANGGAPYLQIYYDDSETVRSTPAFLNKFPANVKATAVNTVTWELVRAANQDYYCFAGTWEQTSATFYYREQGQEAWVQTAISGNTKEITFSANTFTVGKTYEYYLEATDVLGTTSQTSVYTFTTPPTQITSNNSPTSGYINPRNAVPFAWYYDSTIGIVEAGNTTLHWMVSGGISWNDVAAAVGANSLTIPANTFPTASTIQWYLSGTDATGYASQTTVYNFSTAAGAVAVTPISPINTVESNNQPITFKWRFSSQDGFAPSRYKFLWKLATDADYTTELDETAIVTEYTFPAYTFPAGEVQWVIIPYNIDGVEGTGQAAKFISYGAPDAPVVYAENAPFTTVSWQASDQQSYRIMVDDVVYGPYFGTEKTFAVPDKLEDGEHTVGVSVVGTYGLWSDWGTSIVNVQNVPGEEIVLGGTGGVDVFLSWATAEETSDFLIFRDNVQIGRTAEISFTDRYAAGEHTYKVINRLSDGNYSESNEVTLDTNIDGTYISPLSGGEWLKIKYMLKSASDQEYEESIETVYNHFAGDSYPSASISNYCERSLKYSAVFLFTEEADHAKFKSMLKRPVIMKFENGNVIVGVIDSWTVLPRKHYYTAYTFSLRQIEWEDYVDDTT